MKYFFLFLIAGPAFATQYTCDYAFMGAPMYKLEFSTDSENKLSDFVTVTLYGNAHQETLTAEPLGAGEKIHAWISKENPQNSIELFVYTEAKAEGDTLMINPNIPFGKEMWGACAVTSPR